MKWSRYQFTSHEEDCLDLGEVKIPRMTHDFKGYARYDILSPVDRVIPAGQEIVIPTGLIAELELEDRLSSPSEIVRYFEDDKVRTMMEVISGRHLVVRVFSEEDFCIRKGNLISFIYT